MWCVGVHRAPQRPLANDWRGNCPAIFFTTVRLGFACSGSKVFLVVLRISWGSFSPRLSPSFYDFLVARPQYRHAFLFNLSILQVCFVGLL
jgi:hypothetical protein